MKPLYVAVSELQNHIASLFDAELRNTGLTVIQAHALMALYQQDGQRPTDIAKAVGRAATSVTPVLDAVESAGYTVRKPHPEDRRAVTIWLTEAGEALRETITQAALKVEAQMAVELYDWLPVPPVGISLSQARAMVALVD